MRFDFGYQEGQGRILEGRLWRRILAYVRPYRWPVAGAVVLSLSITGASLAIPWLIRQGVDRWILAVDLAPHRRIHGLTLLSLVILGCMAWEFAAGFFQVVVLERCGQGMMHRLRLDLFAHLLRQDQKFLAGRPVGGLVTRLTNDIQNMHDMFTAVIVTIFNDLTRIFCIFVLLAWIDLRLTSAILLLLPLLIGNTVVFSRLARRVFRDIRSQLSRLNSYLQEVVSGLAVLQLFDRTAAVAATFARENSEYRRRAMRQIVLFGVFMPALNLASAVSTAIILYVGGSGVLEGRLTIGDLIAFVAYMRLFFQPLRELSQKYSLVQSAMASAERIFGLLDRQPAIADQAGAVTPGPCRCAITFDHVTFGYRADEPILRDVSFQVAPGETVAIVGATGAGKSTIINLLERFFEPNQGEIRIDGIPLQRISLDWLRRQIGLVMQEVFVLPDTLRANIQLDRPLDDATLARILADAQLADLVARLPQGVDTPLGEGGHTLSAGQQQLLALARVLARDPTILILDEATAAIDSETEMRIEKALTRVLAGRTNIVIAHRLATVRRAHRILVMEAGRIVETGGHEELMARAGLYARLQAMQLQAVTPDHPLATEDPHA